MLYVGIDLGTSAVKLLLVDEAGAVVGQVSESYPVAYPHPGWSEQSPADWWRAICAGVPRLLEGHDASQVRAIGVAGQMHGLVALDAAGGIIRPAILWNDGRTAEETRWLNDEVGTARLLDLTGNIAFAGFTAPKLLWMRAHEPEGFARIAHVLLPKDYVNWRLTGLLSSDPSDAAGTLLYDVGARAWSEPMCELCGVDPAWLPDVRESFEPVGEVLPNVADDLGLPRGVVVCAGAGDNAAAAVGSGVVGAGSCNISLGTSGTVFIPTAGFSAGVGDQIHSFCHADGGWHLMGCILSAASCNGWWATDVLGTTDLAAEQAGIEAAAVGAQDPYFVPYLMGERTPWNDPAARGCFVGLRMDTGRRDMTRAVLEGVAFALRDSVEIARGLGVDVRRSRVCGGGAQSALWLQMIANVLDVTLELPATEQGPGYGGAILGAVAAGDFASVADAAAALVRVRATVAPDPAAVSAEDARYQVWRGLYPALRETFAAMAG